jgi:crotonobetainyl-CoA:carnitine CoA-transferase CaiB-like acyl-CoA transferase
MYDILDGIRVVELSMYAFGPSACAVLGDWGADVVKVGHPSFQDPMRGIPVAGLPPREDDLSFTWEILNRNKRSAAIDISLAAGRDVLDDLLREADVFVTNLLPDSRARLRLDVDDVRAVNADIIYGRATGHGARGPDRERGAFDHTSFWCRSGIGHAASATVDEFVPLVGPAFGDLASGFVLASGIVGAILKRQRTGRPSVVDASLLATGMWMFSPAIVASGIYGIETLPRQRHADLTHALVAAYTTADGRQVYLAGVRTDGDWANLCDCLDRPDLTHDARFDTPKGRLDHNRELIEELDATFARRTLDEWRPALRELRTPWTIAQTAAEAAADPQVAANDYLVPVRAQGRTPISLVASPVQFDESPPELRPAPEHGADTEALLLELGRTWEDIGALKSAGVIP